MKRSVKTAVAAVICAAVFPLIYFLNRLFGLQKIGAVSVIENLTEWAAAFVLVVLMLLLFKAARGKND